jgi:adenine-specific DNA glycosylase
MFDMSKGHCHGYPTVWWFPEPTPSMKREERMELAKTIAKAKTLCGLCPVRRECLKYSLDNNEEFGIWGGKDAHERGFGRRRRVRA